MLYTIIYQFNDLKFGFQNSITLYANNEHEAIEKARKKVNNDICRNIKDFKKFTFKIK